MSSLESKKYWNKKIIEWEKSSYQDAFSDLSLMEKIATRFRSPIKRRREVLLNLLKDTIKGKTILELGCGSGDLCFEFLNMGAAKVIGIDISDTAINAAKDKSDSLGGLQGTAQFFVGDVRKNINLPDADFVVGLGFIDYIDIASLKALFAKIKGKFIFSFPEKKFNLINMLHYIYLKSQGCPSFYKFSRSEFDNMPNQTAKCHFFSKENMTFISNFPYLNT